MTESEQKRFQIKFSLFHVEVIICFCVELDCIILSVIDHEAPNIKINVQGQIRFQLLKNVPNSPDHNFRNQQFVDACRSARVVPYKVATECRCVCL